MMTVREELHAMVDRLADEDAAEALEYVRWLQSPDESISDSDLAHIKRGEAEIARGEYVTLSEPSRGI